MLPTWSGTAPSASLQYGPTEGEPALRALVSRRLRALGVDAPAEDDPYRALAYDVRDATPVAAFMAGGSWIYQGSFSKTFAPGLRLGFLAASDDLFDRLVVLKQAVDLHSSRLSQHIVAQQLTDPGWEARLTGLVDFYRGRRDAFARMLERHLGGLATWDVPAGGLFFWLRLNEPIDTRRLLPAAIRRGVAFMPGEEFYGGPPELGTMRVNFSHAEPDAAERGLATLAALLSEAQASVSTRASAS